MTDQILRAKVYGVSNVFRDQILATRALLKFCQDHNPHELNLTGVNNDVYKYVENVKKCLGYFESDNVEDALKEYRKVPFGGNGCFNSWVPPIVYENENSEYVEQVFKSLCGNWSLHMRLIKV